MKLSKGYAKKDLTQPISFNDCVRIVIVLLRL